MISTKISIIIIDHRKDEKNNNKSGNDHKWNWEKLSGSSPYIDECFLNHLVLESGNSEII